MRRKVEAVTNAPTPRQQRALIDKMLQTDLPQYEQELKDRQRFLQGFPDEPIPSEEKLKGRSYRVAQAVHNGAQRYTKINGPLLAIFNEPAPVVLKPDADAKAKAHAEREGEDLKMVKRQEEAFRALGSDAHVVSISGGNHYIFRSNEDEVLRDMDAFIANLPVEPRDVAASP